MTIDQARKNSKGYLDLKGECLSDLILIIEDRDKQIEDLKQQIKTLHKENANRKSIVNHLIVAIASVFPIENFNVDDRQEICKLIEKMRALAHMGLLGATR